MKIIDLLNSKTEVDRLLRTSFRNGTYECACKGNPEELQDVLMDFKSSLKKLINCIQANQPFTDEPVQYIGFYPLDLIWDCKVEIAEILSLLDYDFKNLENFRK